MNSEFCENQGKTIRQLRSYAMKNKVAVLILRISLGAVFLVFGIGKFQNDIWAQTIRNMTVFELLPWSTDVTVIVVGVIELITAAGLILGFFTRWFAALAALQLAAIMVLLNFQQIRDIGLLGTAIYLTLSGNDWGGIIQLIRNRD